MKLSFLVGPIGGGIAEVAVEKAFTARGKPLPNPPQLPEEYSNNVAVKWVSIDGSHGGIEETRFVMENNVVHTFEVHKQLIEETIEQFKSVGHIILLGTGLSLFIDQFMKLYPAAEVYFIKRADYKETLNQIVEHSAEPEMCVCGVYHVPATAEFQDYISGINDGILNTINFQISKLKLNWSLTGNTPLEKYVIENSPVRAPISLAIYQP